MNDDEDTIERKIALDQLREAMSRVVAIGLNDVEAKQGDAGLNAAALISEGVLQLQVVMTWPQLEVFAFLEDVDQQDEPHPLFSVTAPDDRATH